MKYMLLIYNPPGAGPRPGTPEFDAQRARWMAVTREMDEAGVRIAGDALQGPDTATTVRVPDGEVVLSDGPFAETKELLAGYYLVDVADLDAATAWAAKLPNVSYGSVEVRPVLEIPGT